MGLKLRILDYVSDPNIAYVLFTLGTLGLILELYHPGAILPGVAGAISLILAFYGMHTLPMNGAGLLLISDRNRALHPRDQGHEPRHPDHRRDWWRCWIGSLMLFDVGPPSPLHGDLPRLRLTVILPTVACDRALFPVRDRQGRHGPAPAGPPPGSRLCSTPKAVARQPDRTRAARHGERAGRDLAGGERGDDRRRRSGAGDRGSGLKLEVRRAAIAGPQAPPLPGR